MPNSSSTLIILLIVLLLLLAFFSLAEAGFLLVNRYRLRHLALRKHHRLAQLVQRLLERPDRMLGVILLCNTFAGILASSLATFIAVETFGNKGVVIATAVMTVVVLIFGEIAPKTLATIYSQKIAFIAAWPLTILLRLFYPLVWLANGIANGFLRLFGVKVQKATVEHLTHEELITLLHEAGGRISANYQSMLLKVLDLKQISVNDIMVPRTEIVGIDLNEDLESVLEHLTTSQYTRLPLYRDEIDQVVGILHVRKALHLIAEEKLTKESLLQIADKNYFIPEETPLDIQLLNFRREKCRIGLIVDEYGDILGLVTLEDILEEIVGEFTTVMASAVTKMIYPQGDGSYLVKGSINIRDLNQLLHCKLPTSGAKTLSGLIIEYLETIPQCPLSLRIDGLAMEIVQVKGGVVKKVRISKVSNPVWKKEG